MNAKEYFFSHTCFSCKKEFVNYEKLKEHLIGEHPNAVIPNDPVITPAHYNAGSVHEVQYCLAEWGLEKDALLWNAAKYIARCYKKGNPIQDLKKAAFWLNRRIQKLEEEAKANDMDRPSGRIG